MEISCIFFYYLISVFLIKKWSFFKNSSINSKTLILLFTFKFLVGLSLYYIYTYYYTDRKTADIFKYFDDAKYLYENVYQHSALKFWKIILGIQNSNPEIHTHLIETHYWFKPHASNVFNDNRTVIRFNAVIYLFSFGYYHVHTLVLSMLSFIGLTGIYRTYLYFYKHHTKQLLFSCFLIPSVLFWGSGILKESILLFSIGIFIYSFTNLLYNKKKTSYYFAVILTLGLLAITKTYVLIVLIPSIFAWILIRLFNISKIKLVFFSVNIGLILIAFNLKYVHPSLDLTGNLKYKQHDFINVARDTKAGSTIKLGRLDDSSFSYIKNIPNALINGFFRPSLLEVKNIFYVFSAFENTLLLVLLIITILFYKKPTIHQKSILNFGLYFSILLALLIGLTVPVLGAIVRYKVPFMPFIVGNLIVCIDYQKILNLLKKRKHEI